MHKKSVEIIVPCYNEQECVELFYHSIKDIFVTKLQNYDFTVFYVDDGSKDTTLDKIKQLADEESAVKYISLSRNFGKEAAINAGLSQSNGDYIVLMDADLQHPPELLPKMLEALGEGYDCAAARRVNRKGEGKIRSAFSEAFYRIFSRVTGVDMKPGSTDYRMMKRKVVEAILSLPERERFTKGIFSWVGFRTKWIEYQNVERAAGTTKWSMTGLLHYATSGFIAFATTPLRGVIYFGLLIVLIAFIYAIMVFKAALQSPGSRTGYATILLAILFIGGVIITILGMIGEYLARIYMEVKHRPIYIVNETNISDEKRE